MTKVIAIIDGDEQFKIGFEEVLEDLYLKEEFRIEATIINDKEQLSSKKYIDELKKVADSLALVMIDIVIFESKVFGSNAEVDLNSCKEIIENVRIEFPDIPIIMITRFIENKYLPALSWLSLEDVDGVFIKQYLQYPNDENYNKIFPLDKKSIKDIVERAQSKRAVYRASYKPNSDIEEASKKMVTTVFKPCYKSELQIEDIGFTVFKHLMDKLFYLNTAVPPMDRRVLYFRPGFSGCYLFRVNEYGSSNKSWIMKIGEIKKIEAEVNNYKEVIKYLPQENLPANIKSPVSYGNLAAFAVELKEESQTFRDYYPNNPLNDNIFTNLEKVLRSLYRNSQEESVRLWEDYYQFKNQVILKLDSFFEREKKLIRMYFNENEFKELEDFPRLQGKNKKNFYEKLVLITVAKIHGDFNATNILINPNDQNIVLIDFANYKPDHIARDIAKLETDMIFSVLDSNSEKFYSWERIADWETLLSLFEIEKFFDNKAISSSKDEEIIKLFTFICNLRKVLKKIYPEINNLEYSASLLYYSFHYLIYPDISIHKKIFALKLILKIMNKLD